MNPIGDYSGGISYPGPLTRRPPPPVFPVGQNPNPPFPRFIPPPPSGGSAMSPIGDYTGGGTSYPGPLAPRFRPPPSLPPMRFPQIPDESHLGDLFAPKKENPPPTIMPQPPKNFPQVENSPLRFVPQNPDLLPQSPAQKLPLPANWQNLVWAGGPGPVENPAYDWSKAMPPTIMPQPPPGLGPIPDERFGGPLPGDENRSPDAVRRENENRLKNTLNQLTTSGVPNIDSLVQRLTEILGQLQAKNAWLAGGGL